MLKKIAYKIVFNDLLNNSRIFIGKYSGNPDDCDFMFGVSTVMDVLAYMSGGESAEDKFSHDFLKNMRESEQNYGRENGQTK